MWRGWKEKRGEVVKRFIIGKVNIIGFLIDSECKRRETVCMIGWVMVLLLENRGRWVSLGGKMI